MKDRAKYYIQNLKLIPHPEGGYYKEIYRSDEKIQECALPSRYNSSRNFATIIYYLLERDQKSNFHKLLSNEAWHHIEGCSVIIHCISESGKYDKLFLGKDIDKNQRPQLVVPKDTWFAAELEDKSQFALVGCSVFPGFEFDDFELATYSELIAVSPMNKNLIRQFTAE